jgi:hypothetical protein
MPAGLFLAGSVDCKDGRDKSIFAYDSGYLKVIVKKDAIDIEMLLADSGAEKYDFPLERRQQP